ncbi:Uncharacterized protein M6B38_237960 [Iris pallida]|uniref:Uncharacterized protein n=1 Tax=Iris pallida TaxID=29817 RepID=A0AAX6DMF8_IRIPA|nr:Uncharacterized protein M6B38_237960 [Iris pallida]
MLRHSKLQPRARLLVVRVGLAARRDRHGGSHRLWVHQSRGGLQKGSNHGCSGVASNGGSPWGFSARTHGAAVLPSEDGGTGAVLDGPRRGMGQGFFFSSRFLVWRSAGRMVVCAGGGNWGCTRDVGGGVDGVVMAGGCRDVFPAEVVGSGVWVWRSSRRGASLAEETLRR